VKRPTAAIALALLVLVAQPSSAQAPAGLDSLTVRQCIALSQAIALEVRAADASFGAARLDASASRSNAHPELHLHSGAWIAPERSYDPAATNLGQYDLRLVGSMPLYDGGALRRERDRSGMSERLAQFDLTGTRRDVARRSAEFAVGILETTAGLRRRRESREWAESVLRNLQAGARAGVRSPSEAARLQLDLQSVSVELDDFESRLSQEGRELGALLYPDSLGLSFTQVRDSTESEAAPDGADSAAVILRYGESSEVTKASSEVEVARLELESARGLRAPKLGATLDAGLLGTDLTRAVPPDVPSNGGPATFSDRLRRDLGASFSLDFAWPLVQPGNSAAVQAREVALSAAELRARTAVSVARQAALDVLARWQAAARRLVSQRRAAELAESHAAREHSLYLSGAASLLELLDARRLLDDARDRAEAARADLRLARLQAEIGS